MAVRRAFNLFFIAASLVLFIAPWECGSTEAEQALGEPLSKNPAFLKSEAAEIELRKALFLYAEQGNISAIERMLEAGANPKITDAAGATLLHKAAAQGHLRVMWRLIQQYQVDVNALTKMHRHSVVFEAIRSKHSLNAVKILLDAGAKPDAASFAYACKMQDLKIVQLLVEAGADPNAGFVYSLLRGKDEMVDYLLAHGADVNGFYDKASTPLHLAAGRGALPAVKLLLKLGADPNKANEKYHETPLFHTKEIAVAYELVQAGARLDAMNYEGLTPVREALAERGDQELYDWMVAANGGQEPRGRMYDMPRNSRDKLPEILVQELFSKDRHIHYAALRELVVRGRKVLPLVLPHLDSQEDCPVFYALVIAMGPEAEAAIPLLKKHLASDQLEQIVGISLTILRMRPVRITLADKALAEEICEALFRVTKLVAEDEEHTDGLYIGFSEAILKQLGKPGLRFLKQLKRKQDNGDFEALRRKKVKPRKGLGNAF